MEHITLKIPNKNDQIWHKHQTWFSPTRTPYPKLIPIEGDPQHLAAKFSLKKNAAMEIFEIDYTGEVRTYFYCKVVGQGKIYYSGIRTIPDESKLAEVIEDCRNDIKLSLGRKSMAKGGYLVESLNETDLNILSHTYS